MHTGSIAARRGAKSPMSAAICLIGVVCYLFLPGLQALHADAAQTPVAIHAGSTKGQWRQEPTGPCRHRAPAHDSSACAVCRVLFGTHTGTDLTPVATVCMGAGSFAEPIVRFVESPALATAAPDHRRRGPPR